MSVIPVIRTNTYEEEGVSEPLAPLVDIRIPPAPDVIAEQGPGRSPGAGDATRPVLSISPLDLRAPRHYPARLGFLEPAATERAIDPSSRVAAKNSARPITTAVAKVSNRRLLMLAVGLLLLIGGLFALSYPVFLGDFDQWGFQINCGSGLSSAFSQAMIADSAGTHFVDRCDTAIAARRAWSIPLAVTGGLFLGALLISPSRGRSVRVRVYQRHEQTVA